jgi:hypothetical protein
VRTERSRTGEDYVDKRSLSTYGGKRENRFLYGIGLLSFPEGNPETLVPGRRIIGTGEWPQNVAAVVLPHLDKKIPQSVIARLLNVH